MGEENKMVTQILSLPITKHLAINIGQPQHVNLVMAGCGGTGSFLALHLARLAIHAWDQHGINLHMTFVDPDKVEAKNVGRQNFVPAEIGSYKAPALATRYSLAFGLSIHYFNEAIKPEHVDSEHRYRDGWLHLIIGCVDNTLARKGIETICRGWSGRLWWLDCGNRDQSGQVVIGNQGDRKAPEVNPLGFCAGLPLPSVRHPELVQPEEERPSCADAALLDAQSLMVNQAVAGWAASYVYRLVISRNLDSWSTYFDLDAGSARSEYIQEVCHK